MGDLIFIVVTIAFFAIAAGLVRVCDHIIGPDETSELALGESERVEDLVR